MAEADVVNCIKLLTYGKAPGVDGLAAEHYIHGLGSSLPFHISSILTLCLRHGLVPDANFFFLTMFRQQSQYDSRLRFSSGVLVRVSVMVRLGLGLELVIGLWLGLWLWLGLRVRVRVKVMVRVRVGFMVRVRVGVRVRIRLT